ncbi:glycoside hydrolase family 43 protein [Candidatus Enterococcus leclercqii]|uniref:glycoside hydrolase family 43 protein n=1 Tax=Candidatus Enterococcus leclercqii TaxID=1857218 RepID=UPI00137ACDC5|nr:glycoside hydrolase family 43 protein [Enterococcus sp. CU9D]KAF1290785.1 hypothetical protein BAU14_08395 [Enterococcus sp. CU9D]
MKYHNPVLPGFHPDPSICQGEDRYYLVTSSFEYFPGIPIFESYDLVNWQPIGHCITRQTQMTFTDQVPNALGIYAPTIRRIDGRYYVVCTNVGTKDRGAGNFFVWAEDPHGSWSDPIWLDLPGIDPSLLQDKEGQAWYCGADQGIYLCQINLSDGSHGPRMDIWRGTGGADPEGPHIYFKNNWYYLLIAEGGTGYGHMVTMARSREITGPYEACPDNPLLTNRSLPHTIQGIGHADLLKDENNNWWAVCLGIRPLPEFPKRHLLGRETFLAPVDWTEDWPKIGANGAVLPVMEGPLPGNTEIETFATVPSVFCDDFSESTLRPQWNTLFRPRTKQLALTKKGLALRLDAEDSAKDEEIWLGHRLQHLPFEAEAVFAGHGVKIGGAFGISLFLNSTHRYDLSVYKKSDGYQIRGEFQLGPFSNNQKFFVSTRSELFLRVSGDEKVAFFEAQDDQGVWQKLTEIAIHYLTTETSGIFTGPYIGLFARKKGSDVGTVYCRKFTYRSR